MSRGLVLLPGDREVVLECLEEWKREGDPAQVAWLESVVAGDPAAVRIWFEQLVPASGILAGFRDELRSRPGDWLMAPVLGDATFRLRQQGFEAVIRTIDGRRRTFARWPVAAVRRHAVRVLKLGPFVRQPFRLDCSVCGRFGRFDHEEDARATADRHEEIQGFEGRFGSRRVEGGEA